MRRRSPDRRWSATTSARLFVFANVPFYKLNHPVLRKTLEESFEMKLPDEKTLRTYVLYDLYKEVMEKLRQDLDGPIYIMVDKTTDVVGRYVVNLLMGKMDKDKYHAPLLIHCSFLKTCDSSAIARVVSWAIHTLWPDFNPEKLKVFLSDMAAYMLKVGRDLEVLFPSLIHLYCFAHALHRICDTIRKLFNDVSSVKAVFKKAPRRIAVYHDTFPDLPLPPPNPVITRWGTWLETVRFHAMYLDEIKEILEQLDSSDAPSILLANCLR